MFGGEGRAFPPLYCPSAWKEIVMPDPRNTELARNLLNYSLEIKPGEIVYIDISGRDCLELGTELVAEATRLGAVPYFSYGGREVLWPFFQDATEEQLIAYGEFHQPIMQAVDAYVAVRGDRNQYDLADVDDRHHQWIGKHYLEPVHFKTRLNKKWVVLRYPNEAMAASAMKNTRAFQDFFYKVCNLDYSRMSAAFLPLKALLEKTAQVRIKGPGETDISFSIEGMPAIPCDGKLNIPDGEIYTAPVKDSVNGVIQYNTKTLYRSQLFGNIRLRVEQGRIVEASCEAGSQQKLEEIFNTDEGARYFGEFALGVNPYIREVILDTLFDEKIYGSFHFTPGNSYDDCDNGNKSAVHWDIVCLQTPDCGGGEVYFDDVLVRKDGEFVLDELAPLSAEELTK
jgi:aminopeptidase